MQTNKAFEVDGKTISLSVTATSSTSVAVNNSKNTNIRIINAGSKIAFVSVGAGTQTAVVPGATALATCTPILASTEKIFSLPRGTTLEVAAICAGTDSTTLYLQLGEGT